METNILLYIPAWDKPYLPLLKGLIPGARVFIRVGFSSLSAVQVAAIQHKCKAVITTDPAFLAALVERDNPQAKKEKPSLEDYQGSIFDYQGLEILICQSLKQLASVNQGKFIFSRFASKLTHPEKWLHHEEFSYTILDESTVEQWYEKFKSAKYIAIDIETNRWVNAIDCVSYCGIWIEGDRYRLHSVVFKVSSMFWVTWMRNFNSLPAEKIFQNGKYDNAYFLLYNALPTNWLWDTIDLFHSWYSELPKKLDFQSAFCVRKFRYWKHESKLGEQERLVYNAKDSWVTALAFLAEVKEMPDWALNNYVQEFPLIPACFYCEMQGIRVDLTRMQENRQRLLTRLEAIHSSLRKMVDPEFNPRSPKQVLNLIRALGHTDVEDTQEATLQKVAFKSPLAGLLIEKILEYRGLAKLISTYLVPEKAWKGRIFFSLNPFGTDTGRLASKEGAFSYVSYEKKKTGELQNVGLQIQNIPSRDEEAKLVRECFLADDGFIWFSGDYEQAEARDTAYLSGDENLIAAVDGYRDFHAVNASAFFGIPYEQIVDTQVTFDNQGRVLEVKHKTLNKPIRDLAKRVNHGSNYNMGPEMLVLTMGLRNIFRARDLLKLPKYWTAVDIAKHLLSAYEKTYPVVKTHWYNKIRYDVLNNRKLVGPTGWTRYCFGRPDKNKLDMNAYASHPPQSLNAMTLNIAFKKVFYEILPEHHENLRIKMQIHDEITGQVRKGYEHLVALVEKAMVFPVTVKDTFGKERKLVVPVAMNIGKERWSELK